MNKIKSIVSVIVFAVFLLTISTVCLAKPAEDFSDAERRELAQFPELSAKTLASGEFSEDFETYAIDQFPERQELRSLKAFISYHLFKKVENNGVFSADGHISKLEAAENQDMMDYAAQKLKYVYDSYLLESNVYFSVVPDKNYYLAPANGYPCLDYKDFAAKMKTKLNFAGYIDIGDLLSPEDYYYTDTHWKQEKIIPVARHLATEMGKIPANEEYTVNSLGGTFYGVYSSQYALSVIPDTIKYLTNPTIDNAIVTYYDTGMPKPGLMYNMEKARGKDPYEMFLSGAMPLVTLERAEKTNNNHLILFRDSYGSAIAPLFLESYDKVTVVDIRYVQSAFLKNFGIEFAGADVLFLYSTSLLNNSLALR